MKTKKITLWTLGTILTIVSLTQANAQAPGYLWAKSASGNSGSDWGSSVFTDASGNILVTGYFRSSSITFGTTTLTNAGAVGTADIFIVKYNLSGNVLWAKRSGGTGNDEGNSVSSDANGNTLVTGYFYSSSIVFGTTTLTNAGGGNADIFIVKYDPLGNMLWAKRSGGTNSEYCNSISTDATGNILVTGFFKAPSIIFGTTTLTNAGAVGTCDIFIVKYNPSGNVLWAKRVGGIGSDYGNSVTTDASGNILVTGYFQSSTINILGTIGLINQSGGTADMFIVKYDPSGNALWARPAGGTSDDFGNNIVTDASGNILVTGYFQSSSINFTFGATPLTLTNAGSADIFIVKYDPTGNILWAKRAGGIGYDVGCSITTDSNENIIATGFFISSSIAFETTSLTNAGSADIFIVKYDPTGNMLWAKRAGGTGDDEGYSVTTDTNEDIIATGFFYSSSVTFGTTTLTNGATSGNSADIFIAKILNCTAPTQPVTISGNTTVCSGSSNTYNIAAVSGATSYTWALPGGWTGTSTTTSISATASATSGNISVKSNNSCGSSSSQILSVNVNALPTITANASATTVCAGTSVTLTGTGAASYSWSGGVTNGLGFVPSSTTTYTVTGTSGNNCSNTATKTITVNPLPDATTNLNGLTITANQTGAAYQWLNCNNGNSLIAGATNQSYTASINGDYAVIVTLNDCSNTSACVNFNTTGIDETVKNNQLTVYPNPNNGVFIIKSTNEGVYSIINELGQTVQLLKLNSTNNYTANIENLNSGTYFIIGFNNNKIISERVVVTK